MAKDRAWCERAVRRIGRGARVRRRVAIGACVALGVVCCVTPEADAGWWHDTWRKIRRVLGDDTPVRHPWMIVPVPEAR